MMRFSNIFYFLLLSFGLCYLLAFLIDGPLELTGPTLETLTSVITIFTSMVLFSTAIAVYRKFNGSQVLVDRQTEKVVEFLNFLNTLDFSVSIPTAKSSHYNIHVTDSKQRREEFVSPKGIDYRTYVNTFDYTFFGMYNKFDAIASDPYIPKVVAEEIKKKATLHQAQVIKDNTSKIFSVRVRGLFEDSRPIDISDTPEAESERDKTQYESINKVRFVYEDLMDDLSYLHGVAYSWLSKNNPTVSDSLNIVQVTESDRSV